MKLPDTFILSAEDYHDFEPFIHFLKTTVKNIEYKEITDEIENYNSRYVYHMIFSTENESLSLNNYRNIQRINV